MSIVLDSPSRLNTRQVPGWMLALAIVIATVSLSPWAGELSRPLFVIGCAVTGWYAWRQGPGSHLQAALVMFALAPFVRRIVDLSAGYDPFGLMLTGPLLAILVPAKRLLQTSELHVLPGFRVYPLIIVGGCVAYAAVLSVLQADFTNAASGALKWLAPLLYAAVLIESSERDQMIEAATSAFLMILPVVGLYGIYQYIDPPDWDRYWMQFAPILSAGQPIPYGVRTFSTMNGPASFATFTATGLMLVCFSRARWCSLLLALPAAIGLLLSLYRTAWISLAVGVLFCLLFPATRKRATGIVLGGFIVLLLAATLTPFGEVIGDRLGTLSEGSQDGSAQARLEQFVTLWNQWDSSLFGVGFTFADVGSAGAMPVDGMIIACWLSMGIVIGGFCLAGLAWAAANALNLSWTERSRESIIIGALSLGALAQLPLANITSGENGFLFWTFVVLLTNRPSPRVAR